MRKTKEKPVGDKVAREITLFDERISKRPMVRSGKLDRRVNFRDRVAKRERDLAGMGGC